MHHWKAAVLVCLFSLAWTAAIAQANCASDPANLLLADPSHNCNFNSGIAGWTGSSTPVFNMTDQGCPAGSGVNAVETDVGGSIQSPCININDLTLGSPVTWGAALARIGTSTATSCNVILFVYGNDTCTGGFQLVSQTAVAIGSICTVITGTFTPTGNNAAVRYDLRCASGSGSFIGDNLFLFSGTGGVPVELQRFTIE